MRTLIILVLLSFFTTWMSAQVVPPPQRITASDDKVDHINITWEAVSGYKTYTVYRGESRDTRQMRPLSKSLQSDRFQDRNGLKTGKRYFYAVRTEQNGQLSAISNVDDGRLLVVANDGDSLTKTLSATDCLSLSVDGVDSSNTGYIDLTYAFANTCEKDFPIQTLRFYASKDAVFDTTDVFIQEKKTDAFPIDNRQRQAVRLSLPLGTWYVFVERDKADKPLMRKIVLLKN